jgi:hypothetical protein
MGYAGLVLTTIFGGALGIEHLRAFLPGEFFARLHAHVHLAVLGWVLPVVLGVSAHVYPLFVLAPRPGRRVIAAQAWGLALGVPAVVIGLLMAPPLAAAGALVVAVAVGAHLVWMVSLLRSSRRPAFDWALRFLVAGAAYLAVAAALGIALATGGVSGPRWALTYGVLGLGGWVSLTIVGMMLKIVPFLVWLRAYAPRAGRAGVPTLAGLGWPRAEAVACVALTAGVAVLAAAVGTGSVPGIRLAGVLLCVGAAALAATLGRVLSHLGGRSVVPAPVRASAR